LLVVIGAADGNPLGLALLRYRQFVAGRLSADVDDDQMISPNPVGLLHRLTNYTFQT